MEQTDGDAGPSGFDLVPDDRRGKLICMIAAKLTGQSYEYLRREVSRGRVLEQLTLAMSANYSPPRD